MNLRGRLLDLQQPVVMGILNVTPDSFFDGGRYLPIDALLRQAGKMLDEGAQLLDIGGASSRPGAELVPEDLEKQRVVPGIEAILKRFPETLISIDTWRAGVAQAAVEAGAGMLNDISAGRMDPALYETLAQLNTRYGGIPYILTHMRGIPQTMQQNPHYEDVVTEVLDFFIAEIAKLRALNIADIVLDPGFGFGKTLEHNYALLKNLQAFNAVTGLPVLAGISRKSMICKVLKVKPEHALNGTTALHMVALQQGARILRAHDVKEAVETIRLWTFMETPEAGF
jgi:dihydropteroate synthase